jgi:hypothetical protein
MRKSLTVLVAGALAAFGVASAQADEVQQAGLSDPAAAASAPAASEPSAAPAAPVTTAASPAVAAAPQKSSVQKTITLKMATVRPPADFKIPAGYQAVNQGLDTVYCTRITPVGSRIPQTYCLTLDQVKERQRQAEIARREVAQKTSIAGTSGGP